MSEALPSPQPEEEHHPLPLAPLTAEETNDDLTNSAETELEHETPILLELGTTASASHPSAGGSHSYELSNYTENIQLNYLPHQQNSNFAQNEHLYNNPYTQSHHHLAPTPLITSIATYPVVPTQLSQTIYTWNTASNRNATEMSTTTKTSPPPPPPPHTHSADILPVPPPMYISYVGAREHLIAKESNPTWKEKAMQIEKGM